MTSISYRAAVVVGAMFALTACGGDKSKADSALAADSMLNRDLRLAGQDTGAKPQLTDVPKAPATKTSTKTAAKAPAAKAPVMGTVASGTQLTLSTSGDLCTNTNKAGDTYMATLNSPVLGSNGATIPAGAVVMFSVTKLNRSENANDPIEMVFSATSIAFSGKSYPLDASINPGFHVEKVKNNPKGTTTKNVVGGAAVGAIAGQLLGKNTKSTVIGAAVGGAAGAAAAAAASNYEGCIRTGTAIVVTLTGPLTIPVA
jgi:hypothetical protein